MYDNTSNNPFNPSNPPVNVSEGEATTDEMMMIYFTYTGYQPGDENIIIDSTLVTKLEHKANLDLNTIQVYPNPITQQYLMFNAPAMEGKKCNVCLTDLTGRTILEQVVTLNNMNNKIELPVLNNGMYILLLQIDNNMFSHKINFQQ